MFIFIFPLIYLFFIDILEIYYKFFNLRKMESKAAFIFDITGSIIILIFVASLLNLFPSIDEEVFYSSDKFISVKDYYFISFFYPSLYILIFFLSIIILYFKNWHYYIYDLLIDYFQQNYEIILFLFEIFFIFFFFFFFDFFLNYYYFLFV
jgi:hypothetical protein